MTIAIELPERINSLLVRDAEQEGMTVEQTIVARLTDWYDAFAEPDPVAVEAIRESLEDIAAGRTISLEEYQRCLSLRVTKE